MLKLERSDTSCVCLSVYIFISYNILCSLITHTSLPIDESSSDVNLSDSAKLYNTQ
jgi:hypothetical protein